ncbi:hypothetical protein IFR05_012298 [Cadophora sp. M221]|nr:hypothetical protein IFR05_012298 [Cadophora sp. M221]
MSHSPQLPNDGEIPLHHLQQLLQHNTNLSYPQEQLYDDGSRPHSRYPSPVPQQLDGYYQQQQGYAYDQGMRNQYVRNQIYLSPNSLLTFEQDGYSRQIFPDRYSTPATSPPSPSMSSRDMLRSRSAMGVQRGQQHLQPMPEGRSRVAKSPKPKRAKSAKVKVESKSDKPLTEPLSIATKDWDHIPIADIETYVNRSAEERRKEVENGKIPGKVKRPMNSFMLYRKAYQKRTRDWCLENNHQIVSRVCGKSWPLEPEHIKTQFSEWARIERINHQNAHPGYKFSPSKPGGAKGSKRKVSEEPATDDSDLDDFDWQNTSKRSAKKHRPSPRMMNQQHVAYPTTESAYQYTTRDNSLEPTHNFHPSSYQFANPGRQIPPQYQVPRQGEYYQQIVHNNPRLNSVQDVHLKRAITPGPHAHLGLPGGNQFDLMGYPRFQSPLAAEYRIDPTLMVPDHPQQLFDNTSLHDPSLPSNFYSESQIGDHQWEGHFGAHDQDPMPLIDPALGHDGTQIQDPHAHILKGNQEGWQVETLEDGDQFNKWMDEAA